MPDRPAVAIIATAITGLTPPLSARAPHDIHSFQRTAARPPPASIRARKLGEDHPMNRQTKDIATASILITIAVIW